MTVQARKFDRDPRIGTCGLWSQSEQLGTMVDLMGMQNSNALSVGLMAGRKFAR